MLSLFPDLFFLRELAPLILRLVLGVIFIAHGYSKLPVKGNNLIIGVGVVELLAGVFLFTGFLTQLGAILIVLDRLWAMWVAKLQEGFLGGYEFDVLAIAVALSLLFLGPGFLSIDIPY